MSFIKNVSFSNEKTIILGDFNQNIPKKNQPEIVFSSLKKMIDGFNLLTSNMALIHIVISSDLKQRLYRKLPLKIIVTMMELIVQLSLLDF